jgi:hypothetical protein
MLGVPKGHCEVEHLTERSLGRETDMVVDKDAVTETLRARGDHDRAMLAESALSRSVDLERDAGTLHQLGLNVADVEQAAAPDTQDDEG